eukprot:g17094.t1
MLPPRFFEEVDDQEQPRSSRGGATEELPDPQSLPRFSYPALDVGGSAVGQPGAAGGMASFSDRSHRPRTLDAISPLRSSRSSMTWNLGNSQERRGEDDAMELLLCQEVFQRATAKCSVKLGCRVRQINFLQEKGCPQQVVVDDQGHSETFDRVVLAIEWSLLQGVEYHDEDWLDVPVHQDASCLPMKHHQSLLERAAFLIDVDADGRAGGGVNVEYTHNLGAFSPSARSLGVAPADCLSL